MSEPVSRNDGPRCDRCHCPHYEANRGQGHARACSNRVDLTPDECIARGGHRFVCDGTTFAGSAMFGRPTTFPETCLYCPAGLNTSARLRGPWEVAADV